MKCGLMESKRMTVMLCVGLAMAALGAAAGALLPESMHVATRVAGFLAGMGAAFAAMSVGVMIWRRIVGDQKARESAMFMEDERGQAIAYKAQSAAAIAAVLALVIMIGVAAVRGDTLYLELGTALCCMLCVVKLAAWYLYNKKM